MSWLQLKFKDDEGSGVWGTAWVTCGGFELTPDCTTLGELECRIREMKADLDRIILEAKHEFNRT